jgi:hypothetical protein
MLLLNKSVLYNEEIKKHIVNNNYLLNILSNFDLSTNTVSELNLTNAFLK